MARLRLFLLGLALALLGALAPQRTQAQSTINPVVTPAGIVMGGVQDGRWVDPAFVAENIQGDLTYNFYSSTALVATQSGARPTQSQGGPCEGVWSVGFNPAAPGTSVLGVGGPSLPLRRTPLTIENPPAEYEHNIRDLLVAQGISQPQVRLTQVLSIDLDGDRTNEVLISAARLTDASKHSVSAGDYSVVVMRKVAESGVVVVPLATEFHTQSRELAYPSEYRVDGAFELNGNGRMEVVVRAMYWEGVETTLYEISGQQLKPVLQGSCNSDTTRAARCFPEKGRCVGGLVRAYWERHGGLSVFGYPTGPAALEVNRDTGKTYTTQWFERTRLELHPENAAPYNILLGRIGDDRLRQLGVDWQTLPRAAGAQPSCLWFEQTSHNVCNQGAGNGFLRYWQSHGLEFDGRPGFSHAESLALFGLPLSEPKIEKNSSGDTVLTQWFERARFEWHPDNPAEHRVLLGLLGAEVGQR